MENTIAIRISKRTDFTRFFGILREIIPESHKIPLMSTTFTRGIQFFGGDSFLAIF